LLSTKIFGGIEFKNCIGELFKS